MTNRDFVPGGLSRLQVKDLDNVLAEAGTLALPTVQHVRDRFAHYVDVMGVVTGTIPACLRNCLPATDGPHLSDWHVGNRSRTGSRINLT
uniref:Uncharacterized protein n=1 Tax=Yoonia rhodophyticola TaxID=3137370 RepID=A0AAN0NJD0_9RHOB